MRIGLRTNIIFAYFLLGLLMLAIILGVVEVFGSEGTATVLLFALPPVLVVSLTYGMVLGRLLTRRAAQISQATKRLAKGDLDFKIELEASEDELGQLVGAYQEMLQNLRSLVKQIQITSGRVLASSQDLAGTAEQMNATIEQVSASTQQISKGAGNTAERVDETAKIMREMAKAVEDIAENARVARDTSFKASDVADLGKESVDEAVRKMEQLYATVTSSAAVIQALGERSKEISKIVDFITNITDQTNMLALNAAIEAARAGEHGRGFAVVAEEVKNLAEDSKRAADRIAAILEEIHTNTQQAVETMAAGTREVTEGMETVNNAGNALGEVAAMSKETAQLVEGISADTEHQRTGTNSVATSIDEIARIAESSAAAAQESAAAVQELTASMEDLTARAQDLSETALNLQSSSRLFKLGGKEAEPPRRKPPVKRLAAPEADMTEIDETVPPKVPAKVAASLKKRGIEVSLE